MWQPCLLSRRAFCCRERSFSCPCHYCRYGKCLNVTGTKGMRMVHTHALTHPPTHTHTHTVGRGLRLPVQEKLTSMILFKHHQATSNKWAIITNHNSNPIHNQQIGLSDAGFLFIDAISFGCFFQNDHRHS